MVVFPGEKILVYVYLAFSKCELWPSVHYGKSECVVERVRELGEIYKQRDKQRNIEKGRYKREPMIILYLELSISQTVRYAQTIPRTRLSTLYVEFSSTP